MSIQSSGAMRLKKETPLSIANSLLQEFDPSATQPIFANGRSDLQFSVFLHPGEYAIATEPCTIRTLLGSCVAVTLWHPVHKVGTMSHCMLPGGDTNDIAGTRGVPSGKYCDQVIGLMLDALKNQQIDPTECQAKIFGGGSMYPQAFPIDLNNIGKKNGQMARRVLAENGVTIVAESVFGFGHRHVSFDLSTGEVWVRHGKLAAC